MGAPRWLDEDEARLWRAFGHVGGRVFPRLDQALKAKSGITWDDFEVLVRLSEQPNHRMRMTDLANVLMHSPSRVTQRVQRLEPKGLVAREKSAIDARVTFATLTTDGFEFLAEAATHNVEMVRKVFIDLVPRDQIGDLADVLERIEAKLSNLD